MNDNLVKSYTAKSAHSMALKLIICIYCLCSSSHADRNGENISIYRIALQQLQCALFFSDFATESCSLLIKMPASPGRASPSPAGDVLRNRLRNICSALFFSCWSGISGRRRKKNIVKTQPIHINVQFTRWIVAILPQSIKSARRHINGWFLKIYAMQAGEQPFEKIDVNFSTTEHIMRNTSCNVFRVHAFDVTGR